MFSEKFQDYAFMIACLIFIAVLVTAMIAGIFFIFTYETPPDHLPVSEAWERLAEKIIELREKEGR